MLAGYSGYLISESFLERYLEEHPDGSVPPFTLRRELADWRRRCRVLGPASSLRALMETGAEPLLRILGFRSLANIDVFKEAAALTASGGSEPLALVVAGWGERLDPLWRLAVVEATRRMARWCLLFNGTHVRLVEAGRLYSRRYAEIDVDIAADDDRACAVLWVLLGAGSFSCAADTGESALHELVKGSERHGAGVCRALRDGVLEASAEVLGALVGRSTRRPPYSSLDEAFEQALTIVYRILFLLFAEARGLVPVWHPVYRESYSVDALRGLAERVPPSPGLWDGLRAMSRLAHAGCRAGDLRVTPFNGRLFAPSRTPLAERRNLDDERARRTVLALSTRAASDRAGRERIEYRDLGVEQLGAVYETLLDYEPRVDISPDLKVGPTAQSVYPTAKSIRTTAESAHTTAAPIRPTADSIRRPELQLGRRTMSIGRPELELGRHTVSLHRGSGLRKATGTFYTPQPIAQYLVRRTLGPLVGDALPDAILQLKVLDPAMGSGAFLVAACGYLGQAYETAVVRTGGCHPSDIGPSERAAIRRTIAERCLYGVDLNPMAVQLARLSLWLTTLAADRPLTFLDHHLQTGDSLLGAWLACLRRAPAARRHKSSADTLPLFEPPEVGDALRQALPVRFALASTPNDTPEQVREKERALASLTRPDTSLSKWKRVADLWCAHWFWAVGPPPASAFGALSDAILMRGSALPDQTAARYLKESEAIAAARRFFHWELEFPEAFFDKQGTRRAAPGFDAVIGNPPWEMIRADLGSADDRAKARESVSSVVRFARDAGVYLASSDGHANRYQLFLERAIALTRPGGRIGLVLPSGLAVDHGSAKLRRLLFSHSAVDAIVGFDNREGVFPIHRSVRFLLVTGTGGAETKEIGCRLGERSPAVLETGDDEAATGGWFPIRVTPATLERLTGEDLALPNLASPIDLAIAERAAALFPPLGHERGWAARFGRELNATDDRPCFQPAGRGLEVVEGKQIEPFHVNLEQSRWSVSSRDADRLLGRRHHGPRLAYRDVASPTNRLTLIAAILPAHSVSIHTVFCLRTGLPQASQHFLCGLFNSFVVNYLARLRVTTHVTTTIVEHLPVPRREDSPRAFREIAASARLLARWRAEPSARRRRQLLEAQRLARLNALVAELYQLTIEEFEYVLETFPLVPQKERDRALAKFRSGN